MKIGLIRGDAVMQSLCLHSSPSVMPVQMMQRGQGVSRMGYCIAGQTSIPLHHFT